MAAEEIDGTFGDGLDREDFEKLAMLLDLCSSLHIHALLDWPAKRYTHSCLHAPL